MGRPEVAFRDMDGKGSVDQVNSTKDSELKVARNQIGRTNLLKVVKRPMGGKFEIDYQREGNTYEMPQSQWVMTGVTLTDGRGNLYRTDVSYKGGYQDRFERDFYGFRQVVETQAAGATIARTTTRDFHNDSYFFKNLMKQAVTADHEGRVWAKTENLYELADVKDPAKINEIVPGSKFPELRRTDTYFYDGKTGESGYKKSTYQRYEYDAYGNVTLFYDAGETTAGADDVTAVITYWKDPQDKYIVGKPEAIDVRTPDKNGKRLRFRVAAYDNSTGNLTSLRLHNTGGPESFWKMQYYTNGNLRKIADPVGYELEYFYDSETNTYVTKIRDNFAPAAGGPYYSTASYNLLFGQVERSTDLNRNHQVNVYDEFGRLTAVCGPYDNVTTVEACRTRADRALTFAYHQPAFTQRTSHDPNPSDLASPAYAVTRNQAWSRVGTDGRPLRTVTYSDGLGRLIQTRKDADVDADGNGSAASGMTVSGKVVFDALGRVIKQGQPVFKSASFVFEDFAEPLRPTHFSYDPLDRTIKVVTPDNAVTTTTYGFGRVNGTGPLYATTRVVDPIGNASGGLGNKGAKVSYKDVSDRIVAVVEYDKGAPITTTYAYDALGQITKVVDAKGNLTTVEYDLLGRRTAITNPDTGRTAYGYDAGGNLTSKLTANYQPGKAITYEYVFNRLKTIKYPFSANVVYDYGAMGAPYNRAGRIFRVTDESGVQERYYGKLGEVTKEEKTVEARTPHVRKKKFTTEYVFDSFGRMLEMTYPDGERLRYAYDNGGLLKAAWGEKAGNRYDYVNSLTYDEFGQRKHVRYGNGTISVYAYEPDTRRLASLDTRLPDNRFVQRLTYKYDLVGNVRILTNGIQTATSTALPAGPVRQEFEYDDLYRLKNAKGWYSFGPGKENNYHNEFFYDTINNFTRKAQIHRIIQPSSTATLPKETNYVLNYVYGSSRPHAVTDAGDKRYTYDAAGNMTGWTHKKNGTRRTITWNEENRVKQIDDNGKSTYFLYDDSGERVVKRGQHGETIYVNRFYAVRNGELGTKSVFAGETRVVSKLVKTPNTVTANTTTRTGDTTGTVPGEQGLDHGKGKKLGIIKRLPDGYSTGINPPVEKDQFFYHGDHLGSSNIITDAYGAMYQHLEYFPFGETWIEEGGSYGGNTPGYKFTGKELDPETGLYYFGARYYDPVLSRWISADPALGIYLPDLEGSGLPGRNGVFNFRNLDLYSYAHSSPVRVTDPDGNLPIDTIFDIGSVIYDAGGAIGAGAAYIYGKATGDEFLAAEGASGFKEKGSDLALAATAVVVPYVSAAALKATKKALSAISKATDSVNDVAKAAKKGEPPQLARGKRAHKEEPIRPGEEAEVRTPSGKRMDRYDREKAHIREIKSNSPREIRRGEKKVGEYKNEMEQATGRPHTTEVAPYDPNKYK